MSTLPKASEKVALRRRQFAEAKTLFFAILVGVVSGYGAVLFYMGIDWATYLFYGAPEKKLASRLIQLSWWHIILVPFLVGLVIGQMLRIIEGHKARGVPHVMEAAVLNEGRMPFRMGILSAVITILSIGGGASTGREGPVVHFGASLASLISRFFKLPPGSGRTLLGCGAAAAVAASFNAPIAGVFFALEVILGHYALRAFAPIVVSAVSATLVSRFYIGDIPVFQVMDHEITSMAEFPAFITLGIICAGFAALLMQSLEVGEKGRDRYLNLPYWLQPALGGLIIGGIALVFPDVMGVGYEATTTAIGAGYGIATLIPLIIAKFAATVICLTLRFGGGVFSPSLVIGALIGGSFGLIAAKVFPDFTSSEGLYAIVGMGAMASAVLGAPISTVLIVFEITGDYSIAIAVMVASAVSSLLVTYVKAGSLFHQQLRTRGIFLEQGKASYLLQSTQIRDHISRDFITIQMTDTIAHARNQLMIQLGGALVVTSETGEYQGLINLADLPTGDDYARETEHLVSSYLGAPATPLIATDPLAFALLAMETTEQDVLPVVSASSSASVIGLVHYRHVLDQYNQALLANQGQDVY